MNIKIDMADEIAYSTFDKHMIGTLVVVGIKNQAFSFEIKSFTMTEQGKYVYKCSPLRETDEEKGRYE